MIVGHSEDELVVSTSNKSSSGSTENIEQRRAGWSTEAELPVLSIIEEAGRRSSFLEASSRANLTDDREDERVLPDSRQFSGTSVRIQDYEMDERRPTHSRGNSAINPDEQVGQSVPADSRQWSANSVRIQDYEMDERRPTHSRQSGNSVRNPDEKGDQSVPADSRQWSANSARNQDEQIGQREPTDWRHLSGKSTRNQDRQMGQKVPPDPRQRYGNSTRNQDEQIGQSVPTDWRQWSGNSMGNQDERMDQRPGPSQSQYRSVHSKRYSGNSSKTSNTQNFARLSNTSRRPTAISNSE